jgi:TP53 regulating kinase and related kinases
MRSVVPDGATQLTTKVTNEFYPKNDWTLLKQGAEARIWKVHDYNNNVNNNSKESSTDVIMTAICKERFAKKYRHPVLDARLTKQRCRMEGRILGKCKLKGMNVPNVLNVDTNFSDGTALIYLECIDGQTVRDYLEDYLLPQFEVDGNSVEGTSECKVILRKLAVEIGETIARLHEAGIVHGDLTTSNMMLKAATNIENVSQQENSTNHNLVLIDFGLAKNTTATEERAVDLYVLERALQSTHPTLPNSFLTSLLAAYESTGRTDLQNDSVTIPSMNNFKHDTLIRLEKVRQRGRKRECFG